MSGDRKLRHLWGHWCFPRRAGEGAVPQAAGRWSQLEVHAREGSLRAARVGNWAVPPSHAARWPRNKPGVLPHALLESRTHCAPSAPVAAALAAAPWHLGRHRRPRSVAVSIDRCPQQLVLLQACRVWRARSLACGELGAAGHAVSRAPRTPVRAPTCPLSRWRADRWCHRGRCSSPGRSRCG